MMPMSVESVRVMNDDGEGHVTHVQRIGRRETGIFYQHELVTKAVRDHLWDQKESKNASLLGRAFYVEVSTDGMSVKVVEE